MKVNSVVFRVFSRIHVNTVNFFRVVYMFFCIITGYRKVHVAMQHEYSYIIVNNKKSKPTIWVKVPKWMWRHMAHNPKYVF